MSYKCSHCTQLPPTGDGFCYKDNWLEIPERRMPSYVNVEATLTTRDKIRIYREKMECLEREQRRRCKRIYGQLRVI